MPQTFTVKQGQNIFDLALQGYGTIEEVVNLAYANDMLLDVLPTPGDEYVVDLTRGDNAVKQFIVDRDWFYNNAGQEATEFLLANDEDFLLAKVDIKIKQK